MIKFLKKRWVYHTLAWVISVAIILLNVLLSAESLEPEPEGVLTLSVFVFSIVLITYTHLFLIDKFFKKRKYFYYFTGLVGIALGFVALIEIQNNYGVEMTDPPLKTFLIALIICVAGAGVRYFKRGIINQYQLQELRAKNAEIELNMLKRQLNPHFLFNTINNICGVNQIDSEKGTDMLMELAEIFRFHLKFSKEKEILLSEEIELLKAYFKLEQLRLTGSTSVSTSFPERTEDHRISPLLLLTFVENAFKHGTHPNKPSFVNIELSLRSKRIVFTVENSVHKNLNPVSTNIGLDNTKKRLELLYPNAHNLTVTKTNQTYKIRLEL